MQLTQRTFYGRLIFLLILIALVGVLLVQVRDSGTQVWEVPFDAESLQPQTFCHLPDYDAFDPSIIKYIKSWPRIDCGQPQPPLTFVRDGFIYINRSALQHKDESEDQLVCYQEEIIRFDDGYIELGPVKEFTCADKIREFSIVSCKQNSSDKLLYQSGHANVKEVPGPLANRSRAAFQNGKTSVLILIIESMSRLNFIRQLPKSEKFIKETLKGITMNGLTKVGDNTFPNVMAMLSGLATSAHLDEKGLAPFWGDAAADRGYFDNLPAVWKNFSQHGYVTMFAEDYPPYGVFNVAARGFRQPPTDYYTRPFWIAMEQLDGLKSKDNRCYGHIPKHKFLFNYIEDFAEKMQNGRHAYFAFTFLTGLSHDKLNSIKVIDDDLLALLKKLKDLQSNNTAIFIMGDHGQRVDDYRKTHIGRVEERMPYVAISLPESLEHFRENLKMNSKTLTSWHDVYETLMDVAVDNTKFAPKQLRYGYKGLSLFRPIPGNRTCLQIGIPRQYCVCWAETELKPQSADVRKSAETLVALINNLLLNGDPEQQCAPLELDVVKAAQTLMPSSSTMSLNFHKDFYNLTRLMIQVKPSGAWLEGTIEDRGSGAKLVGNVNRLNMYGNQSWCVSQDATLKLFCFCKKQLQPPHKLKQPAQQ